MVIGQSLKRGNAQIIDVKTDKLLDIKYLFFSFDKKLMVMKNYLFAILLFVFKIGFAQDFQRESIENIANSEKKASTKIMNLAVNPNTSDYDVTYHKLEVTVNPAVRFISGKVTTTYTALANLSTVTFDLANEIAVSAVKKGTVSLVFLQNGNNELVVTLPAMQIMGSSDTLEIYYSGVPPDNGFSAFATTTHAAAPIMWTLSEPFGARDWWPCKQDLNDKIPNIDVYVTAPSQFTAVANGLEPEAPVINGINKTTHFRHNYPIPAYLIAFAVTNYAVINQTAGTGANTFPIINYVYPENTGTSLTSQLSKTPAIMNFYEATFETYPFAAEKYGHAQFGWGGGMEHTTVSFMNNFSRSLIAHELAHQWFGDKLTCGSWKDIWLNEGFATYCASLVIENLDGQTAFTTDKNNMITSITNAIGGSVYLTDTEAESVDRIFSSRLSYNKGAMVLNMLRLKMGSTSFFQAVKNYLADPALAYKYTSTPQFKAHLETVYGSSLSEFFNDWVYGQGYPKYTITGENFAPGKVRFLVAQTQSHPSVSFFEMTLPIRITSASGQTQDLILNNTANNQYIIADANFAMSSFVFDINKDLISKNNITSLGLVNQELQSASFFPNPATTQLSVSLPENIKVEKTTFFNTLGQKVLSTTNNQANWDVSGFSNGLYLIQMDTDSGVKTGRFLKQ